ncbi:hypothetical protein H6G33_17060 [Calothrix sp. FACHB-1219]|uniref:hypothetical protein n=1 Tax=unclassified Calothrix TaxID=2619626 RepID=UPI001686F537|nr:MULTISPECIES: hypothetical protein [unclassified Calothrix]MBD2203144.1 hypothetical protein [Calothrix sp. FACHB-168]MBD2218745.1 hypothetical protein [Calothrix sp. FACHB-1219]
MLADKREQDARTTLDYQNEFIKWYGYLRHAALVPLCGSQKSKVKSQKSKG